KGFMTRKRQKRLPDQGAERAADAELVENSIGPNEAPEGFYDAKAAEKASRSGGGESGRCGTERKAEYECMAGKVGAVFT
ncbi:MAG: hypothetical protein K2P27_08640, partial [Lachnospiraceae bacterium]|nr:hypothetical protein [Lachnospiraceae bacterium]